MKIIAIIYRIMYKVGRISSRFRKEKKNFHFKKKFLQCPIINKLKKLLVEVNLHLVNLRLVKLDPKLHLSHLSKPRLNLKTLSQSSSQETPSSQLRNIHYINRRSFQQPSNIRSSQWPVQPQLSFQY